MIEVPPAPKVAIITRTKSRELLLGRTIESVLSQTETDWTHVIVNDGGDADELDSFLSGFEERYRGRLKVIHHPRSLGRWTAANTGVQSSLSKYICILDDDDSWDTAFLERMIGALEAETWPETKGIFCHTVIVKEVIDGNTITEIGRQDFNQWLPALTFFELMAWNRFVPVGFLFERSVFDKIGYFDENLPVIGDWDFHIRFLAEYEIAILPQNLAFWHQRPSSSGSYENSVADRSNHLSYRAHLVNKWVRKSLKDGTLGLGDAFGFSLAGELHHRMWAQDRNLDRIQETLGEVRSGQDALRYDQKLDAMAGRIDALAEGQKVLASQRQLSEIEHSLQRLEAFQSKMDAEIIRTIVDDAIHAHDAKRWIPRLSAALRRRFFQNR